MKRSAAVRFVQTLVVALGLVALVGTGSPASANQSGPSVHDKTMFQIGLCELAGGTTTVDVDRTVEGIRGTTVKCTGGLLNGMECTNSANKSECVLKAEGPDDGTLPDVQTVDDVVDPGSIEDVEIVEDVQPVEETVDPVVTEDPVVTDEPVVEDEPLDPLPPVVDESPLDETVPDVEVVEADPVVSDEPVVDDIPQIEVVEGDVIPLQEIPGDLPVLEPAQ